MKYKVGDRVRVKLWEELEKKYKVNDWGGLVVTGFCAYTEAMREYCGKTYEVTGVDQDGDYYLNECGSYVFPSNVLEPLNSHLTFQQKLDRFKREPIGFLVKSKEIVDELAKVFEREGMVVRSGRKTIAEIMDEIMWFRGINYYVTYNYFKSEHKLSYGLSNYSGRNLNELLDITLEELKDYNAPQALEDKLALFKAGTHVLHTPTQEIYDKLMVELEKRGCALVADETFEVAKKYWEKYKENMCIRYAPEGQHYGPRGEYLKKNKEVLTLTPEDFSTTQVITITTDGYRRTTAESNGVTAESLCNPTDTFSIHKGSHIALKRLLEKLEEKVKATEEPKGFHVGDIVEVVRCDFSFADDIKGIQGFVINEYYCGYDVKFPVEFSDQTVWPLYDSELKLVRKYNA